MTISKNIDDAARDGTKAWGIDITVTYVDANNQVQTLDSGALSIKNNTTFLNAAAKGTDLIQATLNFSPLPLPGSNPSFTGTATLISP